MSILRGGTRLQIYIDFDLIESRPASRPGSSPGLSQTLSFPNKLPWKPDSIICLLREAPMASRPLLELKPTEGGDAQRRPVLSEKSGVGLPENPSPGVKTPL